MHFTGYCTRDDTCVCFRSSGKQPSDSFAYFGPDCSKKTCPSGFAWDQLSDDSSNAPAVVFSPAQPSSQALLNVTADPLGNDLKQDLIVSLKVLKGGASGYFQYQLLDAKRGARSLVSSPVSIAQYNHHSKPFSMTYKGKQTGVQMFWDELTSGASIATDLNTGDEYTFTVLYGKGSNFNAGDANTAHAQAECSGRGSCDYAQGVCKCQAGFTGNACQRKECPHQCSGHGVCQTLQRVMADVKDAQVEYVGAFDAQAEMACVCDAGFRGPACDQVECPSQADPLGGFGADGSTTPGSFPSGPAMDCSGRGVCDYALGQCDCFKGFTGAACQRQTNFI